MQSLVASDRRVALPLGSSRAHSRNPLPRRSPHPPAPGRRAARALVRFVLRRQFPREVVDAVAAAVVVRRVGAVVLRTGAWPDERLEHQRVHRPPDAFAVGGYQAHPQVAASRLRLQIARLVADLTQGGDGVASEVDHGPPLGTARAIRSRRRVVRYLHHHALDEGPSCHIQNSHAAAVCLARCATGALGSLPSPKRCSSRRDRLFRKSIPPGTVYEGPPPATATASAAWVRIDFLKRRHRKESFNARLRCL